MLLDRHPHSFPWLLTPDSLPHAEGGPAIAGLLLCCHTLQEGSNTLGFKCVCEGVGAVGSSYRGHWDKEEMSLLLALQSLRSRQVNSSAGLGVFYALGPFRAVKSPHSTFI